MSAQAGTIFFNPDPKRIDAEKVAMILVTGASGNVGSSVLREVMRTGKPVRAMYRSKEDAAKAPSGVSTVIADFANPASLLLALEGVDTVYLVCSPIRELVELESNMLDACSKAGVGYVVQNSALGAGDYPKSFPSWHRKVEEKLKSSGLQFSILRPNGFMQNILAFNAPSIRAQNAFYAAMGSARTSFVDVRDVARVAAKVLTSTEHRGKTYELNGPQAFTNAEVAEKISRITGRNVQYIDIPEEQQRKSMLEMGMPAWQVTALLDLQAYYTGGQGGNVEDTLAKLLGHAPTSLDSFLAEFADSFTQQPGKA